MGEIYEDFLLMKKDPSCNKADRWIRSSDGFSAITQIDICLKQVSEGVEAGEHICKIRGMVARLDGEGYLLKGVFEEYGAICR
jgi:hypothetical protein